MVVPPEVVAAEAGAVAGKAQVALYYKEQRRLDMDAVYELDGELFKTVGEYLDAAAHEYKHGDKDLAVQSLEDHGFSLSDINATEHKPHPISVDDDADPEKDKEEEE